ncbi:GM23038 [Drosophila sechellia]|uniref:GM23038 n=1 Tax=Drosophila sechellia TaxID=7238 RepID=B4I689_DROSE|nr:GM23038 [Drosophila sechellia]
MSAPIRYYYDLMSQPSRALFIIFRLSNMPFEDCVVALRNGMADYDVRIKYPKIRAWLKRVRQSCNPYYDVAHEFVYQISGTGPQAKL